MAAHLEGKGVVTQDAAGLAQKGGATWSHIQIANRARRDPDHQGRHRRGRPGDRLRPHRRRQQGHAGGHARRPHLRRAEHARLADGRASSPTPNWQLPRRRLRGGRGATPSGRRARRRLRRRRLAVQLVGDSLYTNPLMLGYAWQQGRVPLSHAALMRAIELNGVQVDNNKAAFEWGRRAAHDLAAVQALYAAQQVIELVKRQDRRSRSIAKRVEFLTGYQNAAYAAEYKAFVDKVRAAEAHARRHDRADRSRGALPVQADGLQGRVRGGPPAHRHRLPRARSPAVRGRLQARTTTWRRRCWPRRNDKGELVKQPLRAVDAHGLRRAGASSRACAARPFDIFGYTEERKTERALIGEYRASHRRAAGRA